MSLWNSPSDKAGDSIFESAGLAGEQRKVDHNSLNSGDIPRNQMGYVAQHYVPAREEENVYKKGAYSELPSVELEVSQKDIGKAKLCVFHNSIGSIAFKKHDESQSGSSGTISKDNGRISNVVMGEC